MPNQKSLSTIINVIKDEPLFQESLWINICRLQILTKEIEDEINILKNNSCSPVAEVINENFCLSREVRNYERKLITIALKLADGNQAKVTELLRINKSTLSAKIKNLAISTSKL